MASPSIITARKMRLLAAVIVVAVAVPGRPGSCARILAVESLGGKSHWNFMSGIIRALLDKGHSVTAFTPYADGAGGENYTRVDISGGTPTALALDLEILIRTASSPFGMVGVLVKTRRDFCNKIYENEAMITALASSGYYDAVLIEPFLSDCMSYAAHRLDVPLIFATPLAGVDLFKRQFVGQFFDPAVDSNVYARHAVPETFHQRFTNAFTLAYWTIAREYSDSLLKLTEPKHYDRAPSVQPSLLFINGNSISATPTSNPPNVISVGGVHLNEPVRELPQVRTTCLIVTRGHCPVKSYTITPGYNR